ncbi:hypothetical protein D9M68_371590 [compost metagenome]
MSSVSRTVLLLLFAVLLVACSRIDLAYRNLDRLSLWWIDDYLDLSSEQKRWLEPRLQADLDWHCRTQLPRYLDWLADLRHLADQPSLQPEQLETHFDHFDSALASIAERITPGSVELLRGLSDKQVDGLTKRFDKDIRELRKEYLAPSPDKRVALRTKRMEQRLRPWFGRLSPQQRNRVQEWAARFTARSQSWLDNRHHWQDSLLKALKNRTADDFPQHIGRLVQHPDSLWSEEYRRSYADSRRELAELLGDLFNGASPVQRERLRTRLGELRDDLLGLSCP